MKGIKSNECKKFSLINNKNNFYSVIISNTVRYLKGYDVIYIIKSM